MLHILEDIFSVGYDWLNGSLMKLLCAPVNISAASIHRSQNKLSMTQWSWIGPLTTCYFMIYFWISDLYWSNDISNETSGNPSVGRKAGTETLWRSSFCNTHWGSEDWSQSWPYFWNDSILPTCNVFAKGTVGEKEITKICIFGAWRNFKIYNLSHITTQFW